MRPVFKAKLAVWLCFLVTRPQPKEKNITKDGTLKMRLRIMELFRR